MEPSYVGANKRIDAMAVAWLFAQDYVFFNPEEITWDGSHHGIAGMQLNVAKVDEVPTLAENAQMYYQGMFDLLMTIEQDEALVVPRERIHPGLRDAIREGDLTGLTLFNLQACARAFQFLGDDATKRQMLQTVGLAAIADNPDMMACTYAVLVDQRLTRGIPGFYQLVRRMFEDMRAYNEVQEPYILVFVATRNIDADACLDDFSDSVEGAVSESFHVVTNVEELQNALVGGGQGDSTKPGEAEDAGTDDERAAMIALLRAFVLAGDLSGATFPQELLDELDRAENGDLTVNLDSLAERLQEASPEQTHTDPSAWTYDRGMRASAPAFSVAIPDGFDIHGDYTSSLGADRAFVAVVTGTTDDAVMGSDQIVYVDHGLIGVLSDEDIISNLKEWGTPDLLAYFQRAANVVSYDMGVRILEERLVPCVNGKCLVTLRRNFGGCEFYINPLMFDSAAWLKVALTTTAAEDAMPYMDAVCKLAATVELAKPAESKLMALARGYKETAAPAAEIVETFEKLCNPMITARKQDVDSAYQLFLKENPLHTTEDEVFSQARALTRWGDENVDVLQLLVDAYEAQREMGMPFEDQQKLYDYLTTDFCLLYKMNMGSEGGEWDIKAKAAGALRKPEGFDELEQRWEAMPPEQSEAEARRQEEEARRQEEEARKRAEEEARIEAQRKAAAERAEEQIRKKFAKLLEDVPFVAPSETKVEQLEARLAELSQERKSLGLFGSGARKKEIQAESGKIMLELPSVRRQAEEEKRKHADKLARSRERLSLEVAELASLLEEGMLKTFIQERQSLRGAKPGGIVTFGMWCLPLESEKKPLEWIVLKKEGSRALLMTKYYASYEAFHDEFVYVTWPNCSLRKWLNTEFFTNCFNELEAAIVPATQVSSYIEDRVFCLSAQEAQELPASYLDINDSGFAFLYYWLRTTGAQNSPSSGYYETHNQAVVESGGVVNTLGVSVDNSGYGSAAVRPCIYVDLDVIPRAVLKK